MDNKELQAEWVKARRARKVQLALYVKEKTGYTISPDALYDIQVRLSSCPFCLVESWDLTSVLPG